MKNIGDLGEGGRDTGRKESLYDIVCGDRYSLGLGSGHEVSEVSQDDNI